MLFMWDEALTASNAIDSRVFTNGSNNAKYLAIKTKLIINEALEVENSSF